MKNKKTLLRKPTKSHNGNHDIPYTFHCKNKQYLPFLVIALISMLFIVLMYANSYTGYVPGAPENSDKNTIAELTPKLPESRLDCAIHEGDEKCGSSCWFKADNKPATDFNDAKGVLGIMDWNGFCQQIGVFLEKEMCCNDCDCGSGVCYEGICEMPETAPADVSAPVFSDAVSPEAANFVKYLYSIKNSVKGVPNQCAGFIMDLFDKRYTNKETLGITGNAWDMLASMMQKNKIVCRYPGCEKNQLLPGDIVFFKNPRIPNTRYWPDIESACTNIRDNYRLCDYSKAGINAPNYPISTHVAIYGGNDFVFDQWGSATHGTLLSRTSWAGYISAIIRPDYSKLNKR